MWNLEREKKRVLSKQLPEMFLERELREGSYEAQKCSAIPQMT